MTSTRLWLAALVVLSGCKTLNPMADFKHALTDATAQHWAGGAPGSGRGVIFILKFYQLPNALVVDTFFVNNTIIPHEISQVGDTTFVTASYLAEGMGTGSLATDTVFSGVLNLRISGQKRALPIKSFRVLQGLRYP